MKKKIEMTEEDFKKEHKHLVKVLKRGKKKELKQEAKDQENEMKEELEKGFYIIEKAQVRQHASVSKTGKKFIVKEHTDKRIKKVVSKNPWVAKYGHLKLTGYPPPEVKNVETNLKGDIDTHAVLTFVNDIGKKVHFYTKTFRKSKRRVKK